MVTAAWAAEYWSNRPLAHAANTLPMDRHKLLSSAIAEINFNGASGDDEAGEAWIEPIEIGIDAPAPVSRDHAVAGQPAGIKASQFLE